MLSFTILTTDAGATTRDLHDHMPVILDEAAMSLWTERGEVHMPADLDDRFSSRRHCKRCEFYYRRHALVGVRSHQD